MSRRSFSVSPASLGLIGWLVTGWVGVSLTAATVVEDPLLAAPFVSHIWWETCVAALGGALVRGPGGVTRASLPFEHVAFAVGAVLVVCLLLGAALRLLTVLKRGRTPGAPGPPVAAQRPVNSRSVRSEGWRGGWSRWCRSTGRWWCVAGLWFVLWLGTRMAGWETAAAILETSVDLWVAVAAAGWLASWIGWSTGDPAPTGASRPATADRTSWLPMMVVSAAVGLYVLTFTVMNWQLYRGLLTPHGDSAMYEEHLWNVLHGKGFRSYLDQGLFLGEHLQVIHLAILPLYVLWPSHLLLELCQSLALGLTAVPVYWIARRHTGSSGAAAMLAVGSLLYVPLQFLDIMIDLKTFRPIAFGIPLLLLAIDQMERGRLCGMGLLLLAALSAKEDYATVVAPLGVWLLVASCRGADITPGLRSGRGGLGEARGGPDWRGCVWGVCLAVGGTAYLVLALKVVIPWFRGGETVHYARYFSAFGETPGEIVMTMLTRPALLAGKLFTAGTLLYALRILAPLGFLPLGALGRLAVGVPLFVTLCLNELALETPAPVHHFHAPLVPVVLWSAAAGLPRLAGRRSSTAGTELTGPGAIDAAAAPGATAAVSARARAAPSTETSGPARPASRGPVALLWLARFGLLCAFGTGMLFAMHPLSLRFWDPGRSTYWRSLYVPGERPRQFAKVFPLIPQTARVASTDFVHPRFTHHERSYDYSHYLRRVADYRRGVPEDTDFIVIDTQHPYSLRDHGGVLRPEDVPELRDDPKRWELLPDETDGYFIVLSRRNGESESESE